MYLLFAGEEYYPAGGWQDYRGRYATVEQARNAMPDWAMPQCSWAHIVYLETGLIVLEWNDGFHWGQVAGWHAPDKE